MTKALAREPILFILRFFLFEIAPVSLMDITAISSCRFASYLITWRAFNCERNFIEL